MGPSSSMQVLLSFYYTSAMRGSDLLRKDEAEYLRP